MDGRHATLVLGVEEILAFFKFLLLDRWHFVNNASVKTAVIFFTPHANLSQKVVEVDLWSKRRFKLDLSTNAFEPVDNKRKLLGIILDHYSVPAQLKSCSGISTGPSAGDQDRITRVRVVDDNIFGKTFRLRGVNDLTSGVPRFVLLALDEMEVMALHRIFTKVPYRSISETEVTNHQ